MNISGHFIYKGLTIMQHPNIESTFESLLSELKPSKVLEIGTSSGGLTLMIRDILDRIGLESTKLVTYDVYDPQYLKHHVDSGSKIDIRVENKFNHQYSDLENGQEIIDYISSEGTTLVLCDGGSKKNEFRILSKFLKVGDVIMAHDYSPNEQYFKEFVHNKIWNWLEIQDSDLEEPSKLYNLEGYKEKEFNQVVWACRKKVR
jgi:cephalosporin hydroxylase